MEALRSEWGSISNLRFLLSSIGSVSANASNNGNNVFNIFCVGMEAYACVQQDGYSATFIKLYVNAKSLLIDLEALVMGNRAQVAIATA